MIQILVKNKKIEVFCDFSRYLTSARSIGKLNVMNFHGYK